MFLTAMSASVVSTLLLKSVESAPSGVETKRKVSKPSSQKTATFASELPRSIRNPESLLALPWFPVPLDSNIMLSAIVELDVSSADTEPLTVKLPDNVRFVPVISR